jgi:hypothetical protein
MKGAVLGVAMAGLLGSAAQAVEPEAFELRSFGDLVTLCDAEYDAAGAEAVQLCRGYIIGAGSLYLQLVRADAIKPLACAEPTPTVDEARARIVAWAKQNPASHAEQPIDGLWRAAASIWPCTKS